jgi:hypothetical protein
MASPNAGFAQFSSGPPRPCLGGPGIVGGPVGGMQFGGQLSGHPGGIQPGGGQFGGGQQFGGQMAGFGTGSGTAGIRPMTAPGMFNSPSGNVAAAQSAAALQSSCSSVQQAMPAFRSGFVMGRPAANASTGLAAAFDLPPAPAVEQVAPAAAFGAGMAAAPAPGPSRGFDINGSGAVIQSPVAVQDAGSRQVEMGRRIEEALETFLGKWPAWRGGQRDVCRIAPSESPARDSASRSRGRRRRDKDRDRSGSRRRRR